MKNISQTVIYRDGVSLTIIAHKTLDKVLVKSDELTWNHDDESGKYLTLDEISDQLIGLGYDFTFYVWKEIGLRGKIYQFGNHGLFWEEHGETKGYA